MQPILDNLLEVFDHFKEESTCRDFLINQRWNGKVSCPHCGHEKVYTTNRGFKCASKICLKKFSVTSGTVMENTKLPLRYWIIGIYMAVNDKKGIRAKQLGRYLKTTTSTAWFLLQRIRKMLENNAPQLLEGTVQLDETFVGGKNKNRHADKKVKNSQGRSFKDKTPVMGMLQQQVSETVEREHKVIPGRTVKEKIVVQEAVVKCFVVPDTKAQSIQPHIRSNVKSNSIVVSDEWHAYNGLNDNYWHYIVDHSKKQYVNEAGLTSNALEGGWSILKHSLTGVYHHVGKKHLQLYCNEFTYRYNTKNMKDDVRFLDAVKRFKNSRITYKQLVA